MRVLGIDPGFGRIGWGVIEGRKDVWKHIAHGCIETCANEPFVERLAHLHTALKQIIATYGPDHAGVEDLFFSKNVSTGVQVAHARGVIILTLVQAGLAISEPTPVQVKQAMTGYGRAEKRQVQNMVHMTLGVSKEERQDDALDALAVAFTAGVALDMEKRC
ncbi:MAG: crossover junction endodeoxyribonuclease RuvC [Candidatus Magasanikbacteria bacterium CG10_big_fil_rev_8_21_14_0_10_43_6]|uniref:Crossover junction endodeoxyribonuclease RuvC n=1 Tax=Candidatus Magasanikbacteria bacterium CG10_big_fil_rev_8_21_14_0_10_43_6 TaxID=1974650 RepID=A0A2M6W1X5_9BACT|nr:MAG: crossover junction endodeoxyribonuclease RuvC [Candidatus Magasanikbacteria bacterium CG10_big_fil_rev_8_21_14_0_10_43_6]